MMKLTNQQGQMLGVAYSGKGHLVFMFWPGRNTQRFTSTCYYSTEIAYNAKILKTAADMIISNEDEVREWLKQITIKFTMADGGFIYIGFTDDSVIVRNINQQGQEIYSFVCPFDAPTIIALSDFLSQWAMVQAFVDVQGGMSRRQLHHNQGYQNQYGGNPNYPPQQPYQQSQQYYGAPQPTYPQQPANYPPQPTQQPTPVNHQPVNTNQQVGNLPGGLPSPDEM